MVGNFPTIIYISLSLKGVFVRPLKMWFFCNRLKY